MTTSNPQVRGIAPRHTQSWMVQFGVFGSSLVAMLLVLHWGQSGRAIEIPNGVDQNVLNIEATSSGTVYTVDPNATFEAQNHVVTSTGADIFSGTNVNQLVGANRFYNAGYTGANTITSNIEAGHVWGTSTGHRSTQHVTTFVNDAGAAGETDRHATWVSQAIGGRPNGYSGFEDVFTGVAYGTDLRSGAVATSWSGSAYATGFFTSASSAYTPYASSVTGFGAADVINSSWGFTDPAGSAFRTVNYDGLARSNPNTTLVTSAGNAGAGANSVGGPGSGFNSIAVGALQNDGADNYNTIAGFSSRSPSDYFDAVHGTVSGVRAAVEITAPGTDLTLAMYGGATGGNGAGCCGGTASGSTLTFNGGLQGTSFAAPIVAGGVALMKDAAIGEGLPGTALNTLSVKAALLNSADKPVGWTNGQSAHSNGNGGVTTAQALDYTYGAGAMNLDRAYDQFITGQADISGTSGGISNQTVGWDLASAAPASFTDIVLATDFEAGTTFTTTLNWFRNRVSNSASSATDVGFADLNLQVWDSTFSTLYSESNSEYNSVEHLTFDLPGAADTSLGLRVLHDGNLFGSATAEDFGIAWSGTAGTNDTTIGVDTAASSAPIALGRVMLGQTPSTSLELDKTGGDLTTFSVSASNSGLTDDASGSFGSGNQREVIQLSLVNNADGSGSTGDKSIAVTVDNLATTSTTAGQGSSDPNDVFNITATVLDDRTITGSPIDFGTLITGAPVSGNTTLATSGADNERTRVTVQGAQVAADSNGIGAVAGSDQRFDGAADTAARTLSGTVTASGGLLAGSVNFARSGEGLAGESVNDVSAAYTGTVLDHAEASFASAGDVNTLSIDFGTHTQGATVNDSPFDIFNLVNTAGFTAGLDLDLITPVGDTSVLTTNLAAFEDLAAGELQSFWAAFDTSEVGKFAAIYTLSVSDQDLLGAAGGANLVLELSGVVAPLSAASAHIPEPSSLALWLLAGAMIAAARPVRPIRGSVRRGPAAARVGRSDR